MEPLKAIALKETNQKKCNMNNVSHKIGWNSGITQAHVEPQLITLIKEIYYGNIKFVFVKPNLLRYPMFSTSDLYEFRMSFFHGNPDEFMVFVRNSNMNLAATGILDMDAKIQYLRTLVRGEVLRHFDSFPAGVKNTETINVELIIKGLAL